jgi:hypothetical protein
VNNAKLHRSYRSGKGWLPAGIKGHHSTFLGSTCLTAKVGFDNSEILDEMYLNLDNLKYALANVKKAKYPPGAIRHSLESSPGPVAVLYYKTQNGANLTGEESQDSTSTLELVG